MQSKTQEITAPISNADENIAKDGEDGEPKTLLIIHGPDESVGRLLLLDPKADSQQFRAQVVERLTDFKNDPETNKERIKYWCILNNDDCQELLTHNQIMDCLTKDAENPVLWKFQRIVSVQGPLKPGHKDCNGSSCNVVVEWLNGEVTAIPLDVPAADDPVTCVQHARDNGLLDTPGWKQFKGIAKHDKKNFFMAKQACLHSFCSAPKHKCGVEIPKDFKDAQRLDAPNGNTKWANAQALELSQIDECQCFKDKGHMTKVKAPEGHKRICVHFVHDCKHDGRHKACLAANGNLTNVPLESVHSGVVSLCGFCMVMFLAELSNLEFWATDIGDAHPESHMAEKIHIVGGEEFGDEHSHILVIHKAPYGVPSSGQQWHDRLFDCPMELGFAPCKAEPDIWLRQNGNMCKWVAIHVDDLALAFKDPQVLLDQLTANLHNFKLKGSGPITFQLGMDFFCDSDGVLCMAPEKHKKTIANCEQVFGEKPKQNVTAPIENGNHPEMDTTELLGPMQTKICQSFISGLQWIVTSGQFDVMTAVMTLSSFCAAPYMGHLEQAKRICGHLSKMCFAMIHMQTKEPNCSDLPVPKCNYLQSVHGTIKEIIPDDAPPSLGNWVTLTHCVDANLMHDLVTGQSVTGILHLLNKTPLDWFSKKQSTVEIATYSSEMLAACACVEQIIDLRTVLRCLGVPVCQKSHVLATMNPWLRV